MGVRALLHDTTLTWKPPILHHKEANERKHLRTIVSYLVKFIV